MRRSKFPMNISTLGLMKKTGCIVTGFDAVEREIKNPASKICGVALAKDLSPKSRKEILFAREKFRPQLEAVTLPASMEQIGSVLGKKTGIIAVMDIGFWKSMTVGCEPINI